MSPDLSYRLDLIDLGVLVGAGLILLLVAYEWLLRDR